ncbi:MAG: transposase [Myxococcota bacterium]|jgi:hypothetical protein|nr:transposase [Myxococcota bacterium]
MRLVDEVLPVVPYRQWVLSMPFSLHRRMARDPELLTRVLGILQEEIRELLRGSTGDEDGQTGAFSVVQLFGSSLNLHVHVHSVVADGTWKRQEDGTFTFRKAPTPTKEQLSRLMARFVARVRRFLPDLELDDEEPLFAPVLPLQGAEPFEPTLTGLHAQQDGFDLHAGVLVQAWQRQTLERLLRYILRGPIVPGRLTEGRRGRVRYELKSPKPDGTTHVEMTPEVLLTRLSWLVPVPGMHMVRYHGVLASASPMREKAVLPAPEDQQEDGFARLARLKMPCGRSKATRTSWADLLRRIFAVTALVCPSCGATRKVIAAIEEGPVCREILEHLDLPHDPVRLAPARDLPQTSFWPAAGEGSQASTGPPFAEEPVDLVDPPWVDEVPVSQCPAA